MFFKILNWLLKKKIPYTTAVVFLCTVWVFFVGFFYILMVFTGADFELTGTGNLFLLIFFIVMTLINFRFFIKYGVLRIFGIKWEKKEFIPLNDNVINGQIKKDVSSEDLLQIYYAVSNIAKWKAVKDFFYAEFFVFSLIAGEWFFSGQTINLPIIFLGGQLSVFYVFAYAAVFYDMITSPLRKECKKLLSQKGVRFEEIPFLGLKRKSKLFFILISLALFSVLILIKPFNPLLLIILAFLLIIILFLNNFIFDSIYTDFSEIKESIEDLAQGKEGLFFSGSSDKEVFTLSQSLNDTAQKIINYQRALENEKASLEIRIKARTKELEELTQGLDLQVEEKTKELRKKIDELERWQRLSVGRELKMVELKKKISNLEKKLGKNK